MDASTWIGIAGVVIAVVAAAGTVASAFMTRTAVRGAKGDASEARSIAERAVDEARRIADASEERVRLAREQIEEERERAAPNVRVTPLKGWVVSQHAGSADIRIHLRVHNLAPAPDVLDVVTVGFGTTIYRLDAAGPNVRCFDLNGMPVRIPLHLECDRPVDLALEFSPEMVGRVETGWESPAAVECHFERAGLRRVGVYIQVP